MTATRIQIEDVRRIAEELGSTHVVINGRRVPPAGDVEWTTVYCVASEDKERGLRLADIFGRQVVEPLETAKWRAESADRAAQEMFDKIDRLSTALGQAEGELSRSSDAEIALAAMEGCCERLAETRQPNVYDALIALDEARRAARRHLEKTRGHLPGDVPIPTILGPLRALLDELRAPTAYPENHMRQCADRLEAMIDAIARGKLSIEASDG